MLSEIIHVIQSFQVFLYVVLFLIIVALVAIVVVLLRNVQRLQSRQQVQPLFVAPRPQNVNAPVIYASAPGFQREMGQPTPRPLPPQQAPIPVAPPLPVKPPAGDLLDNTQWLALVEDCIEIFAELDRNYASFDASRQALARHVSLRIEEILGRSGVTIIQGETTFERHRHQPEDATMSVAPDTPIVETLSPGFAVGSRILRRARVRLS
ncbi:MAG TPA: hypothetical protein VKU38_15265 [Ktedonobacteraceae bacterium]|nr:hypothetical protein [Ktedonobacteraceae bacterium]